MSNTYKVERDLAGKESKQIKFKHNIQEKSKSFLLCLLFKKAYIWKSAQKLAPNKLVLNKVNIQLKSQFVPFPLIQGQ